MNRINAREIGEGYFKSFAEFLLRVRWVIVLGALVVLLASHHESRNLTTNTSFEGMLHPDNPVRLEYNDFRDEFGQDRIVTISIRPDKVFDFEFLSELKVIHEKLENNVPYVKKVTSLINVPRTYGKDDTLYVEEFLEAWPATEEDLVRLSLLASENESYTNYILSEDGLVTAIVVETEGAVTVDDDYLSFDIEPSSSISSIGNERYFSEVELNEIADGVMSVMEPYRSKLDIAVTGGPIIDSTFDRIAKEDLGLLGVLVFSTLFGLLAFLFRRISGVVLPTMVVAAGLVTTMSTMSLLGFSITVFTNILPNILTAIGIAGSVHILTIFYRYYDSGLEKNKAIVEAMAHSGLPIVMTSITTAAGFLSFSVADLAAIGEMGLIASMGALILLFYTLILLPVLISIVPIRQCKEKKSGPEGWLDRLMVACASMSSNHPVRVATVGAIVAFAAVVSVTHLQFYHDMMEDLPDEIVAKQDLFSIERDFKGSIAVEVVIDTGVADGVKDPEFLRQVDDFSNELLLFKKSDIYVGKVSSIVDMIKDANQALNNNDSEYHIIPNDKDLISQELLLLESGSLEDVERFVDRQYQSARISIKIPWAELFATHRLVESLRVMLDDAFPADYKISITGMASLMGKTFPIALESMARSYVIAFAVVSMIMILLAGRVFLGLLSMVPNVLPILVILGVMAILEIPLNLAALLLGSIAIGIVVDDTVHIIYNLKKYNEIYPSIEKALEETLLGAGKAICITSLVLGVNFMSLAFSTLKASSTFGVMLGLVILVALIIDLTLAPALFVLYSRGRSIFRQKSPQT